MDTCVHGGDGCVGLTLTQLALPEKQEPPITTMSDFIEAYNKASLYVTEAGARQI